MNSDPLENTSGESPLCQVQPFPRMDDSSSSPFARTRARPAQSVSVSTPDAIDRGYLPLTLDEDDEAAEHDLFEKRASSDSKFRDAGLQGKELCALPRSIHEPVELPIELMSLTDRFVNSLSAKVHSSPPTIEKISGLFQEFYSRAESHIATHISALASRISRDVPLTPVKAPRGTFQQKPNNRDIQDETETGTSGRQMLTASEIAEKRKTRKFLAEKRVALEEAVERRACEAIYDKIFQHQASLDEVRDEKLRSKTGALLLVGITLKDLGIDIDAAVIGEEKQREADNDIFAARERLQEMSSEKYPLGKLQCLAAAHKAIVDALTKLLPSSSSADEILPALIYSLVTCPPEGINIISNLLFIQRFRSSSKMFGEAAYCLTNLEAAVSFLENVDLSDLCAYEGPSRQLKSQNNALMPSTGRVTAEGASPPSVTPISVSSELSKSTGVRSVSTPVGRSRSSSLRQRSLNDLLQPPSKVLGAANDVVRSTADQGLKNIGAALDGSFSFFLGRLRELQSNHVPATTEDIPVLPKTLEDAGRLVAAQQGTFSGQYPSSEGDTLQASVSSIQLPPRDSSLEVQNTSGRPASGDAAPQDHDVYSPFAQNDSKTPAGSATMGSEYTFHSSQAATMSSSTSTPLESSMRYFGNSLNPLNHIPGMIKGFGRPAGPAMPVQSDKRAAPTSTEDALVSDRPRPNIHPPIQHFLEVKHANDLTIGDVSALLDDYKRLAAALFSQTGNLN